MAEKNWKAKIKIMESKIKEKKEQNQEAPSKKEDDLKLKSKIQVLEKNNEFLKAKINDLEKKIAIEKENNQLLSNKINKINLKSNNQEKIIKSFQKITLSNNENNAQKESEIGEKSIENLNEDQEKIAVKKTVIKKLSDDTIIFLSLFDEITSCLETTLPIFFSEENEMKIDQENEIFDLGIIFYPNFNKIVCNLIELSPILNKNYDVRYIHSYIEFFLKIVNFAFRFKSQNQISNKTKKISPKKILLSTTKGKSLQDHVNEIMFSSISEIFKFYSLFIK